MLEYDQHADKAIDRAVVLPLYTWARVSATQGSERGTLTVPARNWRKKVGQLLQFLHVDHQLWDVTVTFWHCVSP